MFGNIFKSFGGRSRAKVLLSPVAGKVIPLSQVNDPTFAKGLLGQGIAIQPSGWSVVAPADSYVEAIFPTGHAVAVRTDDGLTALIHLGLDTVKLEGRHFKVFAAEGDHVKKGDVLIEFNREAIMAEGYDITVPILLCNSIEYASIKDCVGTSVRELDPLLTVWER